MNASRSIASQVPPFLLATLIILAPLFRAGNTPLATLLLELLAVVAFLALWWGSERRLLLGRLEIFLLAALVFFPLLQLLPLPGLSRADLPGQAEYFLALQAAGVEQGAATLSIITRDTLSGWLVLLVPIAVYLLTRATSVRNLKNIVTLMLAVAAGEAVLGLVQFGSAPSTVFSLGSEANGGSAVGTYASCNNFAGFMYLSLMLTLALFMANLGRQSRAQEGGSLRARIQSYATADGHRAFSYGVMALLLLLAIIFTRSRAGIVLTVLGVLLASAAFSSRIGGANAFGRTGVIVSVATGLSIAIGLGTVLERFTLNDPLTDGRVIIFDGVFGGIGQFFPLGSGVGTFRETFARFQDLSQASYLINRAHNSYLEWVYTGGVVAIALILGFLALYFSRWFSVWKRDDWGEFRYIQVGAGLGLLLMLLHELVDYNLFIPANMVYFAFLAGLYLHPYNEPVMPKPTKRKGGAAATPSENELRTVALLPQGSEPESNPFMN
jgi:O-antigen ligase